MAAAPRGLHALDINRSRPRILPATAPLIGIVTHELRGEPEPAWAPAPGRDERDRNPHRLALRLTYTQAVQEAGGMAVVVPAHGFADDNGGARSTASTACIFSGGPDLDPAVYGQLRHPQLGPDVDRVSDEYELALLRRRHRARAAGARHLPRDAGAQRRRAAGRCTSTCRTAPTSVTTRATRPSSPRTASRSRSARCCTGSPAPPRSTVNSFHHQAVDRARRAASRSARGRPDATVEAIWDPAARFCLGVQWHPEVLTHRAEHAPLVHGARRRGPHRAGARARRLNAAARVSRRADRLPRAPAPGRAGHAGERVLHGRQRRALPRGRRGARDRRSSGVAEHIYRFSAALEVWEHPFWRRVGRATTSTSTAGSCARRPTCGSGSRPTSCPGREDRIANLLEARDWDYVVGSVHFLRDRVARHRGLLDLGHAASRPRRSGGATSRRSPSRRSPASTTSSPTPTS